MRQAAPVPFSSGIPPNAKARGAIVHWAADADEHNAIVLDILRRHQSDRIVKTT